MSTETKRTIKGLAFEIGTVISLLMVGMSAAYGYGQLNSRVSELEVKCQDIMKMREDIAITKTMVTVLYENQKEKKP